ncbi:hypothetical protein TUM4438_01130 [Shewanella sairae]|uniref:Uncharacterized protein n=1 Tax=Shewanella sairae TaxID=190310 RepID=A0ABQ4NZ21_9GAMM|nr:hypothetical protein [Shewanella sairae]MCL1130988.1 hypothetical protein [Shewanella sairae]GIU40286.1 hypothetical protein TUM4438_01130 [Shewanella sairae]
MNFTKSDKSIKKELLTSIPLYILSVVLPILAWHGCLKVDDNPGVWFQRSGSLMVLFAVWVEFKLFKIGNYSSPRSPDGQTWDDMATEDNLKNKYSTLIEKMKYLAAILAIIGTLIWGYGDLFLNLVK